VKKILKKSGSLLAALIILTSAQSCKKSGTNDDPQPGSGGSTGDGLPTTALVGADNLTQWKTYKASPTNAAYNWVLIGDSYTQGNYYAWKLFYKVLNDGYADGGSGYCSFSRVDDEGFHIMDQSIDPNVLYCTYDYTKWNYTREKTIGPDGWVTNTTATNATITVTSKEAVNTLTIVYERPTVAQSFRYRVNGGAWTTVNLTANATTSIGTTAVDVSAATDNFTVDIDPLSVGMNFCGVISKWGGNKMMMDKCGISGARADYPAQNDEWNQSMQLLAPQGALIQYGVNEQIQDIDPAYYKTSVQNIITKLRAISPNCDIILMSPPQTVYETSDAPRKYKQADYAKVLYQLSLDNKTAYINLNVAFGPFAQANSNGLFNADRTHPSDKGGDLITNTIYSALKK